MSVSLPVPLELIGCSGGYHPEDVEEHQAYIAHDLKQRQVQHRVVPEDYLLPMAQEDAGGADAAEDVAKKTLLALSAKGGAIVKKAALLALAAKGAPKSVPAQHPDGAISPILVGPSVCSRTLSLSDAPNKAGSPYPCGDCVPTPPWCLPTPLWCPQILIIRSLSS